MNTEEREYQEDMINTYGGIPDCDLYFAELINCGGYNSEEEFWNNLLE